MWKDNWPDTQRRFKDWWEGKGFIIGFWNGIRRAVPRPGAPDPGPPDSLVQQWTDIPWRAARSRFDAACTDFPLETLPVADPWLGPGSMALYLGSEPEWQPNTVWYHPCLAEYATHPPIRFDPGNRWWRLQTDLMDAMTAAAAGDYLVGCPDVIEHWDVLASLRDSQTLLMDMIESPGHVKTRMAEIDAAWLEVFGLLHGKIRAQDGASMFGWFRLWAPGRVSKVQCDGCAMFSEEMFREFVVPSLARQCAALDYSMYHLDGTACVDKLDALLEIEPLDAIEWTPEPRVPTGGSPQWYGLYRRILRAGKRVQVLGAAAHEIEPLLDAVGGDGVYFLTWAGSAAEAEEFQKVAERLRS